MALITGRLLSVKGANFVLCADDISEEAPDPSSFLLQDSSSEHAQIWINPDEIRRLRSEFPGVPVYGFWQTLLNSKLIEFERDAIVHEEDSSSMTGVMLSIRDKRAHSTVLMIGGYPAGYQVDDVVTLDDSIIERMVLPKKPALLPDEIQAAERRTTRIAVAVCSAVAVGCAVAGWAVDLSLQKLSESRVAKGREIDNQSMQVEAQVGDYIRGANPVDVAMVSRNQTVFSRLYEIQIKSDMMQMRSTAISGLSDASVELRMLPTGLSFPSVATATPGVPLSLQFSLDGTTDGQVPPPPAAP